MSFLALFSGKILKRVTGNIYKPIFNKVWPDTDKGFHKSLAQVNKSYCKFEKETLFENLILNHFGYLIAVCVL